jgi:fatty-acyl-CoA synthase
MAEMHQPDWMARWALYRPDRIAVEEADSGATLTYRELNRAGDYLAGWLQSKWGMQQGDRVAVLADFGLEYVALFAAALKAGFILVPLNYRLAAPEIAWQLQDAEPALLLCAGKYRHLLSDIQNPPPCLALEELPLRPPVSQETRPFLAGSYREEDPVFLLYTSGTTGTPKGAIYSRGMLFWNSINTAISLHISSDSRTVNCMPPFHTGGWNVLLTPFLHLGGYVCLMRKFDAGEVLRLLREKRSTLFMGVPTMLRMISEDPGFTAARFPDLHYLIVGGEAMPVPLIETWHAKGVMVRQGYGLTEVGPNLTSLHQDDAIRKKGSIGRPNFYVDIRVCDDEGREMGAGERGELCLRGPMVTPGYWQNPEATARAFRDGWFRTGDLVIRDEEGYLFIVDRLKNMYISGGENVYPAEVERVLLRHPGVAEAAVIGVADAQWGETGHAWVRPADPRLGPEDLLAWCHTRLAKYKVPKYLDLLDDIPKSDTGKINKRRLAEMAAATKNDC